MFLLPVLPLFHDLIITAQYEQVQFRVSVLLIEIIYNAHAVSGPLYMMSIRCQRYRTFRPEIANYILISAK